MAKKSMSAGKVMALGAGAVALGATAYYFLGAKGKQHQKEVKNWVVDAKKKIIGKIEEEKEVTKAAYENIVDKVMNDYRVKGVNMAEIIESAKMLKKDWRHIVKVAEKHAKMAATEVKKEVKSKAAKRRSKASGKKAK